MTGSLLLKNHSRWTGICLSSHIMPPWSLKSFTIAAEMPKYGEYMSATTGESAVKTPHCLKNGTRQTRNLSPTRQQFSATKSDFASRQYLRRQIVWCESFFLNQNPSQVAVFKLFLAPSRRFRYVLLLTHENCKLLGFFSKMTTVADARRHPRTKTCFYYFFQCDTHSAEQ